MVACTCDHYTIVAPDGTLLNGEKRRDPNCHTHGYPPGLGWLKGDPLRRHARWIRLTEYIPAILDNEGRVLVAESERIGREKIETPRETEGRLYRETRAA